MLESPKQLNWHENPSARLLLLAGPITLSLLSYAFKTVTDTYFLGQVGQSELAAVGLGGVMAFVPIAFGIGLMRAVKVLASQAKGANNLEPARKYLGVAMWLAVIFGAGLGLILLAESYLAHLLAPSGPSGGMAQDYMMIRATSVIFIMWFCAVREYSYALDDTRTPMVASLAANLANVILTYYFVIELHWGVAGAAWATTIATVAEAGLLASFKYRSVNFVWDVARIKRLVRVGLPTAVQFCVEVMAFSAVTIIIAQGSELDLAAHQIVLQLAHLSFLPALGIGEAASVLAGQAFGADREELVLVVCRKALLLAVSYCAICTAIFVVFADDLIAPFARGGGAELGAKAVTVLYISCFWLAVDAVNIVSRCTLQGLGDVGFVAKWAMIMTWCVTPPFAVLFSLGLGWGVEGAWLALTLEVFAVTYIFSRRLFGKNWRSVAERVRRDAMT